MTLLRSKQYTIPLVLFAVSLLVRLVFLGPLVSNNGAEAYDAQHYIDSAIGIEQVMADLLHGKRPSQENIARAYISGWPLVHPFLISLGFLIFGRTMLVARLMMVVLAALTTILVYLVTNKLSNKRAAFAGALIFAIYPAFIHYSLRLLTETTYIFFTFLIIYIALFTVEETRPYWKAAFLAVSIGVLLGITTLTRSTALLWIPTVALWVGWRSVELKRRLLLPALILISTGITLLPWEIALYKIEGRFVLIAPNSDFSLYLGNNPWLPEGYGAAGEIVMPLMEKPIAEYSEKHGVTTNQAYRVLALQEISGDPLKFIRRGFYKIRTMWSIDIQLFKYILVMAAPPMGNQAVGLILFIMILSHFIYLGFVVLGFFNPMPFRYKELLGALVLVGMAVHFATIGLPRYNLPLLAILSPVVGHGVAHLGEFKKKSTRSRLIPALVSIVIVTLYIYPSIPIEYSRTEASTYYLNPIRQYDQWLGVKSTVSDRLFFRTSNENSPQEITVSIVGRDFEFVDSEETQTYRWQPSDETKLLDLVVQSQTATGPFQLQLTTEHSDQLTKLSLDRNAWHVWQPTGLSGIEYLWAGSSHFPTSGLSHQVLADGLLP